MNESGKDFTATPPGVRFGFAGIRGVGDGVGEAIMAEREAKRCTHEARPNDENRADRRNPACANARRGPAHSPTAP